MLLLAKSRGIVRDAVVIDAWYSNSKNLKAIRGYGWVWVTPLRKNRKFNRGESLEDLTFPDEGQKVHLRGYGWVTVDRNGCWCETREENSVDGFMVFNRAYAYGNQHGIQQSF